MARKATVENLAIKAENSEAFIDELEELCKKWAVNEEYFYSWKEEE